jgi:oligosaccharide repeat unit polymerase
MMRKINFLFGVFQFFLILFIYFILFFYKNDTLLISVFVYSFFLGFNVFKNKKKYFLFNDSTGIFLVFLFFYGIFNPVVEFALQGNLNFTTYYATIIYASCIPTYVIGVCMFSSSGYDVLYNNLKVNTNFKNNNYQLFLLLILFLFLLYISIDFYSQGILFNPSYALKTSRLELFTEISQLKIVIGLLTTSIFLYFIYYFKFLSFTIKLILIFLLIYYVLLELSVGNRRDFVPMIIAFFWVLVNLKSIKFTSSRFIFMILGIFLFLLLGSLRAFSSNGSDFNFTNLTLVTLSSNEFVYPFYTLIHSIAKYQMGTLDFIYGLSIFIYPILYFIPRFLFPDKPISLAIQYVTEIDSTMGYAYSPVTDFFINFGVLGPLIGFFFIGIIIAKMQYMKDQRMIFIFFTMIPDFCRSEIGTFFYQFCFVSFFVIIIPNIFKKNSLSNSSKLI